MSDQGLGERGWSCGAMLDRWGSSGCFMFYLILLLMVQFTSNRCVVRESAGDDSHFLLHTSDSMVSYPSQLSMHYRNTR